MPCATLRRSAGAWLHAPRGQEETGAAPGLGERSLGDTGAAAGVRVQEIQAEEEEKLRIDGGASLEHLALRGASLSASNASLGQGWGGEGVHRRPGVWAAARRVWSKEEA